ARCRRAWSSPGPRSWWRPACSCCGASASSASSASATPKARRAPHELASKCLECDDGTRVLDARNGLHALVDEMADIGAVLDVELNQQIIVAGGGVDFGGDLGVGEAVGDLIGLAEMAFDLDEEGNHAGLRAPGAPAAHAIQQNHAPLTRQGFRPRNDWRTYA